MTRDDIIRMAREACDQAPREDWNSTAWVFGDESLVHFAALVAAAEREACAKVCEDEAEKWEGDDGPISTEARLCAINIRARGEK